jgi:hypothetical protein
VSEDELQHHKKKKKKEGGKKGGLITYDSLFVE